MMSFKRCFNLSCGIVVYSVEKSNVFIEVIFENDLDIKLPKISLEFFNIHISFIPLREKATSQYVWSPCLMIERTDVRILDNSVVEHFDDPAMNLALYGVLWSFGIQYKLGKSFWSSLVLMLKCIMNDLWLAKISVLFNNVCL